MSFKYAKQYRLPGYDYSAAGYYFVTVCTHNRVCYFGEILLNGGGTSSMALSPIGQIARDCWQAIPRHFNFISLDEWIIMPNHVHGIIIINNDQSCRNAPWRVPTKNPLQPQPKSLSIIIRTFKGAVTTECRKRNLDFFWQGRFHDHVIRTEKSLQNIRQYIKYNHLKWHKDINNPKNFPIDQ